MAGPEDLSTHGVSSSEGAHLKAQKVTRAQSEGKFAAAQVKAEEDFIPHVDFNPLKMMRRFQALEAKVGRREQLSEEQEADEVLTVKKVEEFSMNYQKKNQELDAGKLLDLRSRITSKDSKEEILAKVLQAFNDYTLADEAIDFLIDTTIEGDLSTKLKEAKETLNEKHARQVIAGRNINEAAQAYAKMGVDSPTALRDMYRDITGNPREAITLFEELSQKYPFDRMRSVIAFLLHSLGADLKSKGPSIGRAELHRLMTDTRSLQAILGVYRFFRSRMRIILKGFEKDGLPYPQKITYEVLARLFIKFLQDRYPSAEKVRHFGAILGIGDELLAQIILGTQMRDAVRQVAPRLFKSEQHRQDVLLAFIDALAELEEEMEEKEEEEEKEDNDEAKE
ncbi:MAG: type III secretion system gatekeeper subunit SctW [Chlamydiota bacterium]